MRDEKSKRRVFFIAGKDRSIFNYLKSGKKKVETRAATPRNLLAQPGDIALFICNKKRLEKKIIRTARFKTVAGLAKKYTPTAIDPAIVTLKQLEALYSSFPGYKEKIKKFGILVLELE